MDNRAIFAIVALVLIIAVTGIILGANNRGSETSANDSGQEPTRCGDGDCGASENCDICPIDCGECLKPVPDIDQTVCFEDILGDFDFEKDIMSAEEYSTRARELDEIYDCNVNSYGMTDSKTKSLAYLKDGAFFACWYTNKEHGVARIEKIIEDGGFMIVESYGPITLVGKILREDGTMINSTEDFESLILPIDSHEKAMIYAHIMADADLAEKVTRLEGGDKALDEAFIPCATPVKGGYEITVKESMHSGGCVPITLTKLTYFISTEGEIELLDREVLHTGPVICVA